MPPDAAPPPISYSIDTSRDVIFEVWRGEVTAADLRRHWEAYFADPMAMGVRRTLVDLRDATIRFTGTELSSLVAVVALPRLKGLTWKTAIVVGQPVQFGVSRQYSVFAEGFSTDCIFADANEALRWLRRQSLD